MLVTIPPGLAILRQKVYIQFVVLLTLKTVAETFLLNLIRVES